MSSLAKQRVDACGLRHEHAPVALASARAAMGGLRGVLAAAQACRTQRRRFALALVLARSGSTYRKPGAVVFVREDGLQSGALSGGCLEPQLLESARRAMQSADALPLCFDTTDDDDLLLGSGSACRGRLELLVLPNRHTQATLLLDALGVAARGEADTLLDVCCADAAAPIQRVAFDSGSRGLRTIEGAQSDAQPSASVRVRVPRARRLLMLGGSPEAAQLAALARQQGWISIVADIRQGHRDRLVAAGADQVLDLRPRNAAPLLAAERFDAVLIMHHRADLDLEALALAAAADALSYVGLLGPPVRRAELLAMLTAAQRARLGRRLHAPVGLPLGGEGAEAIALSIAAELMRHFHRHVHAA